MFFESTMFNLVPFFIIIITVIVFGSLLWKITTGINQNIKNNASPVLTVPAQVIAKRTEVRGEHSHTWYYSTFEVESGDRIEFEISGKEYGLLAEGDLGLLTFQGTRLISFDRNR